MKLAKDDMKDAKAALKDLKVTRKEQVCVAKCRVGGADQANCEAECLTV